MAEVGATPFTSPTCYIRKREKESSCSFLYIFCQFLSAFKSAELRSCTTLPGTNRAMVYGFEFRGAVYPGNIPPQGTAAKEDKLRIRLLGGRPTDDDQSSLITSGGNFPSPGFSSFMAAPPPPLILSSCPEGEERKSFSSPPINDARPSVVPSKKKTYWKKFALQRS